MNYMYANPRRFSSEAKLRFDHKNLGLQEVWNHPHPKWDIGAYTDVLSVIKDLNSFFYSEGIN